jgi:formamidopyrimidine-DNA glycosylase
MPELPEVETVARSLRGRVVGKRITATLRSGKPLRQKTGDLDKLVGARITSVDRYAKYLIVRTDGTHAVLAHLGMTGSLLVRRVGEDRPPHTHVVLELDGKHELWFVDPRRFGQFTVVAQSKLSSRPELAALGPDPFSDAFTVEFLRERLRGRKAPMKAVVLDQKVFAGMGNIYVAEALYLAGISPKRAASRVKAAEVEALHRATRQVLEMGINNRGTSFSDYVDANGDSGDNEAFLKVYGRGGEPCERCGKPIQQIVQSGRSTYYCRGCQR